MGLLKSNKIVKFYNSSEKNRIRLFVFPFAGGSASAFREWENLLAPEIELCSLQLPGREDRYREAPYHDVCGFLQEFNEVLQYLMDLPFVFFGHSLGALLCYEQTRYLEEHNQTLPLHLYFSGARPPEKNNKDIKLSELEDQVLINILKEFNGMPLAMLEDEKLMKIILPVFRADLSILDNYNPAEAQQFSMPITVYGGFSDKSVAVSELSEWNKYSRQYCRIGIFPGDHFYLFSEKENLIAEINKELKYLMLDKAFNKK